MSKHKDKEIPVNYLDEDESMDDNQLEDQEKEIVEGGPGEEHEASAKKHKKTEDDKFKKKYEELSEKYDALNEQFLRYRAEFANYKKRVEREQVEFSYYIKGEMLKKLLPVLDDFQHMLDKAGEGQNEVSVVEGAKIIFDKFHQIVQTEGLQKIDALGKEFDPQIHEALMMQDTDEPMKHNKILSVFQEGYMLKDRLLRPSKVVVGRFVEEESNS